MAEWLVVEERDSLYPEGEDNSFRKKTKNANNTYLKHNIGQDFTN